MPNAPKKIPVKTKFILMVFLTSFLVLLVENTTFIIYERMQETKKLIHDTQSLARIISNYSAKSLLQNDIKTTQESLKILKIENFIVSACIYDVKGNCFASYDSGKERPFEFPAVENLPIDVQIDDAYLQLSEPIIENGVLLGNIFIRASLQELNLHWQNFLLSRFLMILVSSFFLYIITLRLQKSIAKPLENLTQTARTIVASKNYRMRVDVENDDEIGWLAHTINDIIEAVESRETALHRCNERLADFEPQVDYPADLLALANLHIADGIEHNGGRIDAYRKQLRRFRQHFANTTSELRRILQDEKDVLSAITYCNALKGVSGNIGAMLLFDFTSRLSNKLREGAELDENEFKRLDRLSNDVFNDIDSLQVERTENVPVKREFSPMELTAVTRDLLATIEQDLGASEKLQTQLCDLAKGTEFEEIVEAIAVQLDEFNIEQATFLLIDLQQYLLKKF